MPAPKARSPKFSLLILSSGREGEERETKKQQEGQRQKGRERWGGQERKEGTKKQKAKAIAKKTNGFNPNPSHSLREVMDM